MKLVTTSWDDGHPKDFKLAELLSKYGLAGTFYIPRSNTEQELMQENKVVELARYFEVGGHTLNHVRLNNRSQERLDAEIKGCFDWLHSLLGYKPTSFCFPGGIFNKVAVESAYNAGFKVIRTTELLSASIEAKYRLTPTTVQIFNHNKIAYLKNTVKRKQFKGLLLWISIGCTTDILKLLDSYLKRIEQDGGCLHIWGHSWEIDEFGLWNQLENVFRLISGISEFNYISNAELINYK